MTKVNLFLDMDGVLAEQRNDLVNYMYDKNFFLSLPPVTNMIEVAKKLTEQIYLCFSKNTPILFRWGMNCVLLNIAPCSKT